ncbi:MAG: type II secretion system F family protein [Peptococcaceae bacterium]|nr:MAG: type II secretion system F family protein [Peptococcaceae bacterium]
MSQTYVYRVRNQTGRIVTGRVEAEGEAAAAALLRQRKYFIVEVKPVTVRKKNADLNGMFEKKVSLKHLAIFCRQFATIIGAGVPLLGALNILRQQTESKKLKEVLGQMTDYLEEGHTFTEAVRRHNDVFPNIFTSMVEAGEVGGVLEQSMERLATHFEKDHELREKIKSAMTYPAVVVSIACIAVYVLLAFVLPKFVGMLTDAGVALPLPTRIVVFLSGVLSHYWYVVLGSLVLFIFLLGRFRRTEAGKEALDRAVLRMPVFGPLGRKVIISRFSRTLATLIHAGVPILQALEVIQNVVDNRLVVKAIREAGVGVTGGLAMAEPLEKSGVFPPMVTRMIAVGEETGSLEDLLTKIADFYDREVEATVARLSSALEPVLIVGMGVVIGFIIISIMLPMLNVMSGSTVQ